MRRALVLFVLLSGCLDYDALHRGRDAGADRTDAGGWRIDRASIAQRWLALGLGTGQEADLGASTDAASAPVDMAHATDAAKPIDMTSPPPADMSQPSDLSQPADMAKPADMTQPPVQCGAATCGAGERCLENNPGELRCGSQSACGGLGQPCCWFDATFGWGCDPGPTTCQGDASSPNGTRCKL